MVFKKLTLIMLCIGLHTATFARFTTISDAGYSEPDLYQVLDVVAPISSGWQSNEALNTNLSGRRLDDDADQLWSTGNTRVTVLTTFWGGSAAPTNTSDQAFRYDDTPEGTSPTVLSGVDAPGKSGGFTINNGIIGSDGGIYGAWSDEALNSGPLSDRAVTFDVRGLDVYAWLTGNTDNPAVTLVASSIDYPAYIAAFETGTDGDYQDMLVLIESINPVPAPGAIILGAIGLLIVVLRRKQLTI